MGYRSKYCDVASTHCLLGRSPERLAEMFGETPRTVDEWIADIPEFRDAVERGRNGAYSQVEQALYRVLAGYEEEVDRVVMQDGEPTIVRHIKRHPPKRPLLVRP